jgi:serine/threonine-protein kinase
VKQDAEPPAGLPPALECIVMRALARDPAARYPTMAEMAEALAPLPQATPRELAAFVARAHPDRAAAALIV